MHLSNILPLLLLSFLSLSSAARTIEPDCGPCTKPSPSLNPPVTLPPIDVPKVPVPPVTVPNLPVTLPLPPVLNPPAEKPCPPGNKPGKKAASCPIDTLKLGACVDLLGGLVNVGLGDPVVNKCCPILSGLAEAEAAVCLCTTLKVKALNLQVLVPVALQVLVTCGKNPPPGFSCSI